MVGILKYWFLKIASIYYYSRNCESKNDYGIKNMEKSSTLIDTKEKLLQHFTYKVNIKIEEYYNNYISNSKYKFDYQPYDENNLEILRNKYSLAELVKPYEKEFDKFRALQNWIRKQWQYGYPRNVLRDYDTLNILSRAQNGEKFWCSEYAVAFIQCALSLGYQARYVALSKGHIVAEVWSNEYKKWIVMDPTFNIHFEKNKEPLNCLDLYNAFNNNQISEIKVIEEDYKPADININFGEHELVGISVKNYRYKTIDYYGSGFSVRMRNDWFTNRYPKLHPKGNIIMNSIGWNSSKISFLKNTINERDMYPPLNITTFYLEKIENNIGFNVFLNTFTPNFSHFIVNIDEKEKKIESDDSISWMLHKDKNHFNVVSVNKFGVKGVNSYITLYVDN
jgi:hypothetical protein